MKFTIEFKPLYQHVETYLYYWLDEEGDVWCSLARDKSNPVKASIDRMSLLNTSRFLPAE